MKSNFRNAAAWLFTVGEREDAEKLLYRAERETAALKPENGERRGNTPRYKAGTLFFLFF